MFRTEETTEIRFEDGFFDDMVKDIEKLVTTSPKGNFDSGWNAALKNCVYKLYAFFGRGTPPTDVLNVLTPLQPDSDKEEREMVVTAFFDKLVSEILKARIPNPVYDDHKAWNSAIHVCLMRIYKFFGKGEPPEKISNLFLDSIKAPDTGNTGNAGNTGNTLTSDKEYEKALLFDNIVKELLGLRFPCPTTDENQVWNSAIFACLTKLGHLFNKTGAVNDIGGNFNLKPSVSSASSESSASTSAETTGATVATDTANAHSAGEIRPLIDDPITHPSWYCRGGIETIDFIEAKQLGFIRGNAVKYISRAGYKDPAQEIADLRKALFYIDWEIKRLKGKD